MSEKNFEQAIKELEAIVSKLEGSEVSLDESLKLFEDGVKLTKQCQQMLSDAEKKMTVLMVQQDGTTVNFDGE